MVNCVHCNVEMRADSMDNHLLREHKWVQCNYCELVMVDDILNSHVLDAHSVSCKYCKNRMPHQSLEGHMKRKHASRFNAERMSTSNDLATQLEKAVIEQPRKTNDSSESRYYFIGVSERQMEKFLKDKRIYPSNGKLYLNDS